MSTPAAAAASHPTDIHAKALALNLDASKYGTFAEIGAGQEVARWFLRVGAASGTVAQTISAYDKTFSDQTYGAGTRYVSCERLLAMLDHEFSLLQNRLGPTRGADSRFFVFADTVAARNFKGDNEQHGWLGVRFQLEPGQKPSDILLHVNLMDPAAQLQQEAIGRLGVNLIYAAFHQSESADSFLTGLFDQLSIVRLEIDVIELSGPHFDGKHDARHWSLGALRRGMAHALVFDSSSNVVEPSSLLRKRPLLVERGKFESIETYQADMIRAGEAQLKTEGSASGRDPSAVLEMTLHHAAGVAAGPGLDDAQILDRVGRLSSIGIVMVSDFPQSYLLTHYFRRYTSEPLRFVFGVAALAQLLEREFYNQLAGSVLEGLGRFLADNVKVYIYPMPAALFRQIVSQTPGSRVPADGMVTVDNFLPAPPVDHLYRYLRDAGWVVALPL